MRALIANSPGTGKTIIAITALAETRHRSLPALVVCPSAVVTNWRLEFKTWAPQIRTYAITDMSTPIPKYRDGNIVYIIGWALLDARLDELLQIGMAGVVADEAHFSKNPEALRSQALCEAAQRANAVLLLTGTPIINNESELAVLNEYLGPNPLMTRRLLEDVAPDVPEKRRARIPIELRPQHREKYDSALEDFSEWLQIEREERIQSGESVQEINLSLASEALVRIGYLRRMVGDFKVPAAADWIARAVRVGEPVVVFMEHQRVLRKLQRALDRQRLRYVVLDGNTAPKDRQSVVQAFQNGDVPIFLGTQAAKEGITLHAARHLLFLERFFTSSVEEQIEDRIRRIGQHLPTTEWYLHAVDTIDDRIDEIVNIKRHIIREAIGSADTQETDLTNSAAILDHWGESIRRPNEKVRQLGLAEPLPALPSPRDTHAVVFYGDWSPARSLRWCRMNGYKAKQRVEMADRVKMVVQDAPLFAKESFRSVWVSKQIRVLTGKKHKRAYYGASRDQTDNPDTSTP